MNAVRPNDPARRLDADDIPSTAARNAIRISARADRLSVGGEVDALTAADLHTVLDTVLSDDDMDDDPLRLDLSDVTFMDSSGLRVLISVSQRARDEGSDLVLVRPSAPVVRLLEMTHLLDHLTIDR